MKVVAFNGSPREKGNTYFALKMVGEELEKEGIELEIVHVGNKAIRGCIGCNGCAKNRDEKSYFITGERLAIGAWKDSPNKKEALEFLDYLAKPENVSKMATANVLPTGLTNAKSDLGKFEKSYELGDQYQYVGFFDREYLPSGSWETLCSIGAGIISGQLTVEDASKKMREDFDKLKKN